MWSRLRSEGRRCKYFPGVAVHFACTVALLPRFHAVASVSVGLPDLRSPQLNRGHLSEVEEIVAFLKRDFAIVYGRIMHLTPQNLGFMLGSFVVPSRFRPDSCRKSEGVFS